MAVDLRTPVRSHLLIEALGRLLDNERVPCKQGCGAFVPRGRASLHTCSWKCAHGCGAVLRGAHARQRHVCPRLQGQRLHGTGRLLTSLYENGSIQWNGPPGKETVKCSRGVEDAFVCRLFTNRVETMDAQNNTVTDWLHPVPTRIGNIVCEIESVTSTGRRLWSREYDNGLRENFSDNGDVSSCSLCSDSLAHTTNEGQPSREPVRKSARTR